ncbi:hypothetical protein E1286_29985 [Nonomuraea terrae]|uniref:Uncharacterized protein n=1 Tax=Nonomuraea terrae TaxID=2530383 RepID=A0A4R4YFL4_9ACTN|nr:hypothetical protein [Nonomuraea terrae]TDD42754.1 hypothetical protein E1286_29985 [Nonomuraea terrae]
MLSDGDLEAGNVLLPADDPDARLIAFEFAAFPHALRDAVPFPVPGPAWPTVGAPRSAPHPADLYRQALAPACPTPSPTSRPCPRPHRAPVEAGLRWSALQLLLFFP